MKLIILYGASNTGKTTTICSIYDHLVTKKTNLLNPADVHKTIEEQKPRYIFKHNEDITVNGVGKKMSFNSHGDFPDHIKEMEKEGWFKEPPAYVDYILCCCRTKGATVHALIEIIDKYTKTGVIKETVWIGSNIHNFNFNVRHILLEIK